MESWADVEMYSCGGVSPGPGWAKAWAEPAGHWLSGEAASRQSWGAPPGQAKARTPPVGSRDMRQLGTGLVSGDTGREHLDGASCLGALA